MSEGGVELFRRTKSGHCQADFIAVLEAYGYEFVRHTRHGALYRHPELADHPDLDVRLRLARVLIPKGKELRGYVAEDVVASIDALEAMRKERNERP